MNLNWSSYDQLSHARTAGICLHTQYPVNGVMGLNQNPHGCQALYQLSYISSSYCCYTFFFFCYSISPFSSTCPGTHCRPQIYRLSACLWLLDAGIKSIGHHSQTCLPLPPKCCPITIIKELFYVYEYFVMCTACSWCSWRTEASIRSPETELEVVMSYCEGAGPQFLCRSSEHA